MRLQGFALQKYICSTIAIIVLLAPGLSVGDLPTFDRVLVLEPARQLQDVTLVDAKGQPFALSELKGKVALVFFGFTHCADVCPLTLSRFRLLYDAGTLDSEQLNFVLISVDGDRDTPDVMKRYLAGYPQNFIGLTGNPNDVKKVAAQFRAPFYKGNEVGAPKNGYSVAHSPQVFVLDANGALRAELHNASDEAMIGITEALIASSAGVGP